RQSRRTISVAAAAARSAQPPTPGAPRPAFQARVAVGQPLPPTAIRSWHPTRNYRTEVTEIIVCSGDHQVRLAQVFVPHGLVSRRSSQEASLGSGTLGSQRPIPVNSICSCAQNRALLGSNGLMSSFYCLLFDVILLRVSNLSYRVLHDLSAGSSGHMVGKMGGALEEEKWQLLAFNMEYHIDSFFFSFIFVHEKYLVVDVFIYEWVVRE
ncbi:hypothetical protein EJB05_53946, partial [Eragrostis curvula]